MYGRRYSTAGTKGYFLRLGDHCKAEAALHFDDQPEGKLSVLLRAYAAALAACGAVNGIAYRVTTDMLSVHHNGMAWDAYLAELKFKLTLLAACIPALS